MKTLTLAEFDELTTLFSSTLDACEMNEWYSTARVVLQDLLGDVRKKLFSNELGVAERRAEFTKLKAEFDPE